MSSDQVEEYLVAGTRALGQCPTRWRTPLSWHARSPMAQQARNMSKRTKASVREGDIIVVDHLDGQ